MLKMKLNYLRLLTKEIERLKKLQHELYKSRDFAKEKMCKADLDQCKKERDRLLSENLLDKAPLSKREKIMAHSYYCNGMTWEQAFGKALELFSDTEMKEYEKTVKEEDEEEEREVKEEQSEEEKTKIKVKQNKYVSNLKKSIERKIKGTFISIEDKEN